MISQPPQPEPSSSSGHKPTRVHLKLVRRTWETTLGHCDFSDDDNFFNVGGHSMLGIALMKELETELGTQLPVRLLFDNSTVRRLAAALQTYSFRPGEVP